MGGQESEEVRGWFGFPWSLLNTDATCILLRGRPTGPFIISSLPKSLWSNVHILKLTPQVVFIFLFILLS